MNPGLPHRRPGRASCCAATIAVLAVAAGCVHAPAAGYDQAFQATETSEMTDASSATIDGEGVRLDVSFQTGAGEPLRVRYRVFNTGESDLAVFDRGNRHAVMTRRQRVGEVGQPTFHEEGNGDLTVNHVALPLAQPSPTLPPTPLAARLAAGQSLEGEFTFAPLVGEPPRRMRWCLGVAPFDAQHFSKLEQAGGIEVWQASFKLAERQQTVCTPWFDVAARGFQPQ